MNTDTIANRIAKELTDSIGDWDMTFVPMQLDDLENNIYEDANRLEAHRRLNTMDKNLVASELVKLAKTLMADITLSKNDKKVIDAFIDGKSGSSDKLESDGKVLNGSWMGGSNIAEWKGDKIVFNDLGERAAQTVQKAIKKMAPKNLLASVGKSVCANGDEKALKLIKNRQALEKSIEGYSKRAGQLLKEAEENIEGLQKAGGGIIGASDILKQSGIIDLMQSMSSFCDRVVKQIENL